jgi:hypothetical protein
MSKWVKIICLIMILSLPLLLSACSNNSSTASVEPTATAQVLTSDEALTSALAQFSEVGSYTVSLTKVVQDRVMNIVDPSSTTTPETQAEDANVTTMIQCLVNNKDEAAQINSTNTTGSYSRVYSEGRWYILDSSNLLKPSDVADWSAIDTFCTPMKNELDLSFYTLPAEDYSYTGQDTLNGTDVYVYSITLPEAAISTAKKALSSDALTYSDLALTNPQVSLYVDQRTGRVVRLLITIEKMYTKYTWADGVAGNYTEFTNNGITQVADYSNWDTTTVDTSAIIPMDDSSTQTYEGKYANFLTFNFAKVDRLIDSSSESFYISLRDLQGSTLSIMEQPTWYFINESMCTDYAQTVFLQYLQTSDTSASIESANLITVNGLNVCKIVGISNKTANVQYLITEPDDVAKTLGHELNSTYNISITQANGEDPRTLFTDVIQSLKFVTTTSN